MNTADKNSKAEADLMLIEDFIKLYATEVPGTDFEHLISTTNYTQTVEGLPKHLLYIIDKILSSDITIDLNNKKDVNDFILSHLNGSPNGDSDLVINNFTLECIHNYLQYTLIYRRKITQDAITLLISKYRTKADYSKVRAKHIDTLKELLHSIGGFAQLKPSEYSEINILIEGAPVEKRILATSTIQAIKTISNVLKEEEQIIEMLRLKLDDLTLANKSSYQNFDIFIMFDELKDYLNEISLG